MYVIRLHNCAFFARHGALPEEQSLGQRFFIDVELTVDATSALESDDVGETVSYGDTFKIVERIATGERYNLIEALAHRIATALMAEFPKICVAEITVRKPSVPIDGILDGASVTVVLP